MQACDFYIAATTSLLLLLLLLLSTPGVRHLEEFGGRLGLSLLVGEGQVVVLLR